MTLQVWKFENQINGVCCADKSAQITNLEKVLKAREKEIKAVQECNEYLQDIINEKVNEVKIFDEKSKTYKPKFKVYEILKYNMKASKVPLVVNCILKLVDMKATKLPCRFSGGHSVTQT